MSYSSMISHDVPLGPFEGVRVTFLATKGAKSRFHASADCSALRSAAAPGEQVAPVCRETLQRLCTRCCDWGQWAPRGSALGVFVDAVGGSGLGYELSSYLNDRDAEFDDSELSHAAAVLQRPEILNDQDEDGWRERENARQLRADTVHECLMAFDSLMRAHAVVGEYPWLAPWAEPGLTAKAEYAEALREKVSGLLRPSDLVDAATAWAMTAPALPADLSVPGISPTLLRSSFSRVWQRWHDAAGDEAHGIDRVDHIAHSVSPGLESKRKTRQTFSDAMDKIVIGWRTLATAQAGSPRRERLITVRLHTDLDRYKRRESISWSSDWQAAVVMSFMTRSAWERGGLLLNAPDSVADRLLQENTGLDFQELDLGSGDDPASAFERWAASLPDPEPGPRPGVLDDGPISGRQVITSSTVRKVLGDDRATGPCVVFSATHGVETLMPSELARRCDEGWHGILVARPTDLPESLIGSWTERAITVRGEEAETERRPAGLSQEDGECLLVRLSHPSDGAAAIEHDLRVLTLARGVADLRTISTHDERGYSSIPDRIWRALLTRGPLNLDPFRGTDPHQEGLVLPLGILSTVQVYTSNSDHRIEGKGHTPFCQHMHRELVRYFDLLSLRDLLGHDSFDGCHTCGGYVVRRLSSEQERYYREAHRLTEIYQTIRWQHRRPADVGSVQEIRALAEEVDDMRGWDTGHEDFIADMWAWTRSVDTVKRLAAGLLKGR